jgi:hypothetical protein
MTSETKQEILDEIRKTFEMKVASENIASDMQASLAGLCRTAHDLGLSDRQIADHIGLSRTRIQQLRTGK